MREYFISGREKDGRGKREDCKSMCTDKGEKPGHVEEEPSRDSGSDR